MSLLIYSFVIFLVLSLFDGKGCDSFKLPESFLGTWRGERGDYNILGPHGEDYIFSISKTSSQDYMLMNNHLYDEFETVFGWQRFYLQNNLDDDNAFMFYCGALNNFSNFAEQTGSLRLNGFNVSKLTDSSVTFCFDTDLQGAMGITNPFKNGCQYCACSNWTLSWDESKKVLQSQLTMSGSKHLWVDLTKIGPSPVVTDDEMPLHGTNFSCEFNYGGRDSAPVKRDYDLIETKEGNSVIDTNCPYLQKQNSLREMNIKNEEIISASVLQKQSKWKAENILTASNHQIYEHCYELNQYSGYG